MPNPPALSEDTIYHIYNRGTNRENIFIEERNYAYFLTLYQKHVSPFVETYAYCLLGNHFHLLVETPKVSETFGVLTPSQRFSNLFNAYAKAINKAYNRTGSLFQHPFGRVPVKEDAHLFQVVRYIHHNPQKHGFVDDFQDWPYSSYNFLLETDATFLAREQVLEWFGGRQEFIRFHTDQTSKVSKTFEVLDIEDDP